MIVKHYLSRGEGYLQLIGIYVGGAVMVNNHLAGGEGVPESNW